MPETFVALDLETTGLDPEADAIIEIGAVSFTPDGVLDQFATLVRPRRRIPDRVQSLTGITDEHVRDAPILEVVASDLEAFLGDCPLVGHNITAFDVPFLNAKGIRHSDVLFDTHELAVMLLPSAKGGSAPGGGQPEYSLRALAALFEIAHTTPHRALPDATAAMGLFRALRQRAAQLPPELLSQVDRWLAGTTWPGRLFFRDALEQALADGRAPSRPFTIPRPVLPEPLEPAKQRSAVPPEDALAILAATSGQPDILPNFEERAEQQAMVHAVAEALNDGDDLIVEAGTGTGKSLAYLIPAALYALDNGSRVVVSTNTINLQEQLSGKDIPALQALLQACPEQSRRAAGHHRPLLTTTLKGRRNYLCLRRFAAMEQAPSFSDDEARMMARLLIWLAHTETGDKAELRLSDKEAVLWRRFSAEDARCTADNCPFVQDDTCFLLRARRRAEAAHILVVNHALLLSDIAVGGHLLPPYDNLIIDEAHHLEDEATRQLGFSAREEDIAELLDRCQRLVPEVRASLRGVAAALGPAAHLTSVAQALAQAADRVRPRLRQLAEAARAFLHQHSPDPAEYDHRLLISRAMRVQPDWPDIEIAWENLRLTLANLLDLLARLEEAFAEAEGWALLNYELFAAETAVLHQEGRLLLEGIAAAIEQEEPGHIVWFEENRGRGSLTIAWAPLRVADLLRDRLYTGKNAVILTGATLACPEPSRRAAQLAAGGFAYIRDRLGLEEAQDLLLGSPFDFQRAALVLIPSDMPEPAWPDYLEALARAITDLTRATQGRALCLFTSHSTLRAAYALVRQGLKPEGIDVLAQGIDGSPKDLLRSLKTNPRSVILGTASFWEGVDVAGEALSLLIMARLPFSVPTEPVFAARAATFDDPFAQYALPQAALRFKQGFGRLIRSRTDRGVIVVLDGRIKSKAYGSTFLGSLPACPVREARLRELPALAAAWLNGTPNDNL